MRQKYYGVCGIGNRRKVRTIKSLRQLTERVIAQTRLGQYRNAAIISVKKGIMRVYIPTELSEETFDKFLIGSVSISHSYDNHGEPCYPCLKLANNGRNIDGSSHGGYLVIDVPERILIGLVDRSGNTLLLKELVELATTKQVVL